MDYFDIIRGGAGEGFSDSIFKVQDSDGKLLSLRGEVTTQIARMLASTARDEGRLFYITNCINYLERKGLSHREYWQAGAELIGGEEVGADAEVIALTLCALDSLGLDEVRIDVGSVRLFRALTEHYGAGEYERLAKAVSSKSVDDLRKVTRSKSALEAFSHIMNRRGGPEVVEDLARIVGKDLDGELNYFSQLYEALEAYGYAKRVSVDLGTLREMKYYNGTVFEVFLGGVGLPIGGGGRYDAMIKDFGLQHTAATGFAVNVDLCVKALEAKGFDFSRSAKTTRILYVKGFMGEAVGLARRLRERGQPCSVDRFSGEKAGILVAEKITDLESGKDYEWS